MVYGGHAFGFRSPGQRGAKEFQTFYDRRDEVLPWIKEYSPLEHVDRDAPPVFLDFPKQDKPPVLGEPQSDPTHSAVLGVPLVEKLRDAGVEAHSPIPARRTPITRASTIS